MRQHRLERRARRACRPIPAARTGTSRDAGRSLPGKDRPARAGRAPPARRRGSSRTRTRHRRCPSPARSRPDCGRCRGSATAARSTRRRRPRSRTRRRCAAPPSGSRSGSPVRLSTNTAIGTPQARWRLMHQSGRRADHASRAGCAPGPARTCVASIAASALARMRSGPSMRMNHCGVARKISGALERQECG